MALECGALDRRPSQSLEQAGFRHLSRQPSALLTGLSSATIQRHRDTGSFLFDRAGGKCVRAPYALEVIADAPGRYSGQSPCGIANRTHLPADTHTIKTSGSGDVAAAKINEDGPDELSGVPEPRQDQTPDATTAMSPALPPRDRRFQAVAGVSLEGRHL